MHQPTQGVQRRRAEHMRQMQLRLKLPGQHGTALGGLGSVAGKIGGNQQMLQGMHGLSPGHEDGYQESAE